MKRAGWLRVRTTRVVGGRGMEAVTSVYCPFEGRSKESDECAGCEFLDGVAGDPEGRRSLILCHRDLIEAVDADPDPAVVPVPTVASHVTIARILRRETICVRPETTADELSSIFLQHGISGVPVVDSARILLGVVSKTDLLRAAGALAPAATAADLMTRKVITMLETAPVSKAAAIMAYEGVHRLPILDPAGRVVGILTPLDILRWLARNDGYQVPEYTQAQDPRDGLALEDIPGRTQ